MQRQSKDIASPGQDEKRAVAGAGTPVTTAKAAPFTGSFFSPETAGARAVYLKIVVGGCFLIVIAIFAVFSIFWGALWKTPARNLDGWIVVSLCSVYQLKIDIIYPSFTFVLLLPLLV